MHRLQQLGMMGKSDGLNNINEQLAIAAAPRAQLAKLRHIPSAGNSLRTSRIFNARRRPRLSEPVSPSSPSRLSSSSTASKSSAPGSKERLRSRAAYDALR